MTNYTYTPEDRMLRAIDHNEPSMENVEAWVNYGRHPGFLYTGTRDLQAGVVYKGEEFEIMYQRINGVVTQESWSTITKLKYDSLQRYNIRTRQVLTDPPVKPKCCGRCIPGVDTCIHDSDYESDAPVKEATVESLESLKEDERKISEEIEELKIKQRLLKSRIFWTENPSGLF